MVKSKVMRAKTLTIHTHYHLSSDSGEVDSIIERMHLKHIFLTKKLSKMELPLMFFEIDFTYKMKAPE